MLYCIMYIIIICAHFTFCDLILILLTLHFNTEGGSISVSGIRMCCQVQELCLQETEVGELLLSAPFTLRSPEPNNKLEK